MESAPLFTASASNAIGAAATDDLEVMYAAAVAALVTRPDIRAALRHASPDLVDGIDRVGPTTPIRQRLPLLHAAARYISRMSYRPTPFGLFAGVSYGTVAGATRLSVGHAASHTPVARLDSDCLDEIVRRVADAFWDDECVTYHANSSLSRVGVRWFYAKSRSRGKDQRYSLVALDADAALNTVMRLAGAGTSVPKLVREFTEQGYELEEARTYVKELIDDGILVSSLHPALTDTDPLTTLCGQLSKINGAGGWVSALEQLRASLADTEGMASSDEWQQRITGLLATLPSPVTARHTVQIDLRLNAPEAQLSRTLVDDLLAAVHQLQRVSLPRDPLRGFREAFVERFDTEEVPLSIALDAEVGVGLPGFEARSRPPALDANLVDAERRRDAALAELLIRAASASRTTIELTPEDIARLENGREHRPLPASFAAMISIENATCADVDRGQYSMVLKGLSGPSGTSLLGRFCYLDDRLTAAVRSHVEHEACSAPEAVFAELVHLPQARLANVIRRPPLRPLEVPYLGRSALPADQQLDLSDLRVSVQRGRVMLRSIRLDREVIIRCSTAHNFSHGSNLPIYQFLCLLQHQDAAQVPNWTWGAHGDLPMLPRVSIGRLVVSRAQWRIPWAELKQLRDAADASTLAHLLADLRMRLGIPRHVAIAEGENSLPVDLGAAWGRALLVESLRAPAPLVLQERSTPSDAMPLTGPDGAHTNEIILPFVVPAARKTTQFRVSTSISEPSCLRVENEPAVIDPRYRRQTLSSPWTSLKIYCGVGHADRLLTEYIVPLLSEAQHRQVIDGWFFLRYHDPRFHLRVRVHGAPTSAKFALLQQLDASLDSAVSEHRVSSVVFDTYVREIERYGGAAAIELVERVFHADSIAVAALLPYLADMPSAALRDAAVLQGVLTMFRALAAPTRQLVERLRRRVPPSRQSRTWSKSFREFRPLFESVFDGGDVPHASGTTISALYERRSASIAESLAVRHPASGSEILALSEEAVDSLVHMFLNRVARDPSETGELRLLDYTRRLSESALARR